MCIGFTRLERNVSCIKFRFNILMRTSVVNSMGKILWVIVYATRTYPQFRFDLVCLSLDARGVFGDARGEYLVFLGFGLDKRRRQLIEKVC